MKALVVSDTNILIDLLDIGLLNFFFQIGWEIHTTDYVINELTDIKEREFVLSFTRRGLLTIKTFVGEEMIDMLELTSVMQTKSNLSIAGCSVLYYAKQSGAILLTGDAQLRKRATQEDINVRGVIYVLDTLKDSGLLPNSILIERVERLLILNPRLPKNELNNRIALWKAEQNNEDLPMENE